jgi:peptidoglycan/LPS O-acetylase OafA/YrhL
MFSSSRTSSQRFVAFDALRAVAFLAVFFYHAELLKGGWIGVDLFFVLSGFLVTGILIRDLGQASARDVFRRFYLKRAFRILPPFYLVLVAVLLTLERRSLPDLPLHLAFLSNYVQWHDFRDNYALGAFWSISVEEHFYLLWPLLLAFVRPKWRAHALVGIVIVTLLCRGAAVLTVADPWRFNILMTPCRLDALAAGSLLALYAHGRAEHERPPRARFGAFTIAAVVVYGAGLVLLPSLFRRGSHSPWFLTLGLSLSLPVFVGAIGYVACLPPGSALRRLLEWRPLTRIGQISYFAYLVHLPLMYALGAFGIHSPWIALAVTLFLSELSWRLYEQPLLGVGARLAARSRPALGQNVTAGAPAHGSELPTEAHNRSGAA